MFKILLLFFILIPIAEIALFIQIGDKIGLSATLFVVIITAIVGVNLLKQQGFRAWQNIQNTMAQGQVPAIEMAAGAQLLFAGGLLLTPGFLTDIIGFVLMVPQIRQFLAKKLIGAGLLQTNHQRGFSYSSYSCYNSNSSTQSDDHKNSFSDHGKNGGNRTIEGEFEEK